MSRGRFYRFGGILSLLCAIAATLMSLYVTHVMLGSLIVALILSMTAAVLFVGGMVLLGLGTIIDQLQK